MGQEYINQISNEISNYHKARDAYKKQFWLQSKDLDDKRRKQIKKLFMKIDRLRNHIKLWLKHLISKKPSNYGGYIDLIDKGRAEIKNSFKQLDQILYRA